MNVAQPAVATKSPCVIVDSYPNPEEINTTPEGASSKRLLAIHGVYDKVIEGNPVALEIGIQHIVYKRPRFKAWVDTLIERCKGDDR
jgi:hypothetical protein